MAYTLEEAENNLAITSKELLQLLKSNKIKVTSKGKISAQDYKKVLALVNKHKGQPETPIYVLNGHKIQVQRRPYFETEDQRISIFQDDAISFLKGLPAASVDVIITDPAYSGMNQKLKLGKGKIIGDYKKAGEKDAKWFGEFHDTEENYKAFLQECFRVMKPNRHIYIMFDSYSMLSLGPMVRDVFEVKNVLCWDKLNIGLGHYFRRRHEFILFASKGKRNLNSKSIPDVWRIKRVVGMKYPTQKPTEVFELMLKGSAEKDFVVCDPFLGSGSAAIASIKAGCKFLGCDISTKSVSTSKERIKSFLKNPIDPLQPQSHLGDDDALKKLLTYSFQKAIL
jgi:site-specific DNA-methyltransferase (adenine-specific)